MPKIAGTWTFLTSDEHLKRSSHTVACDGKCAWIFGGEIHPRQPVHNEWDIVRLDPAESSTIPPITDIPAEPPTARVGSACTVLNGTVYVFSGRGGVAMSLIEENGGIWSYKLAVNEKWNFTCPMDSAAPFPPARSYHAMTNDGKSTLYVHAGCPERGRLSDLWGFDLVTKTWKELQCAPDPPRGGTSIAYCAGKVYRMNGFDGQTEQGGSVDIYDPANDSWSSVSFPVDGRNGPEARSVSPLLAVRIKGERFLITMFGERDPSPLGHAGAGKMLDDVWAYDIENGSWSMVEVADNNPDPRGWFGADVVKGEGDTDGVVLHGGLANDNTRLGDVWLLNFT